MTSGALDHVNYDVLDGAKQAFINAGKRTMRFAEPYGFVPDDRLGASANLFSLDLAPFLKSGAERMFLTLLPEGLGTADDARPDDLSPSELERFWFNIGIKTVSVLTNDAASGGMQTLLISLYLPSSEPERVFTPEFMRGFLDGFVEGCRTVGCVYFSGETPQLKTKIVPGRLDIAGALFGLVPNGIEPIDSRRLAAGDSIVLVESSGPHENGFTSLRDLASRIPDGYRSKLSDGTMFWEAINAPSKLYTPLVQAVLKNGIQPTNVENITGHGWQKLMRAKQPLCYRIEAAPPLLPVFEFVRDSAKLPMEQMLAIFNCGAGFAFFVRTEAEAKRIVSIAEELKLRAVVAGKTEASNERRLIAAPYGVELKGEDFALSK